MLHACFFYDPTCFMCMFIQYLAFSGTNRLTRSYSASSCFLLFCISEKLYRKYSRNCMGQIASIIKSRNEDCVRRGPEGVHPGGQTPPRHGLTLARAWVASGPTRAPPTPPLRLFIPCFGKTLDTREKFYEKFRSRRHRRTHLGRVLELFPASCWREKSQPEAFFIAMPVSVMMCE